MQTAVYVQQGLTRADTTPNNGQVRHMLTDGENTAVWYGEETDYYRLPAGQFDADDELRLPSYEDVLELDEGQILEADHRYYGTAPCIFVSTEQEGYECCYYVRSADGLLRPATSSITSEVTVSRKVKSYSSDSHSLTTSVNASTANA